MARPERNNVDYFPFNCSEGKKMFYIEETYGNNGFATFVKLLRELAKTDFHYLDLSKNITLMFLAAKCKISKETLLSIIDDLVEIGKFDSVLWRENNVIWCQDFVDSIQDAYTKRNNNCISYEGLGKHLLSLGIRKPNNSPLTNPVKPQRKVEYTKVEERKGKTNSFHPPSFFDIEKFSKEQGYKIDGEKISKLYLKNNKWIDTKGNIITDWKEKLIKVWFKPENLLPEKQDLSEFDGYDDLKKIILNGKQSIETVRNLLKEDIRKNGRRKPQ